MQTDVTLLPVYNKLYNLDLSEAEVEKIQTKIDTLAPTKYSYSFIANNTLVRLYPKDRYWRRHNNVELIPYNKETKTTSLDDKFINDVLVKNLPCYNMDEFDQDYIFKDFDVLKLDDDDKEMLPVAAQLLGKEKNKNGTTVSKIIDSVEDIKEMVREKYLNTFMSKSYLDSMVKGDTVSIIKVLGWAYDMDVSAGANPGRVRDTLSYIYQFTEVAEKNNIRLAIGTRATRNFYRQHQDTTVLIADCDNPVYDYLDKDRQFYMGQNNIPTHHSRSDAVGTMPKIFLLNEDVKPAQAEEVFIDIENRNTDKEVMLVDSMMLETVIKRFQRRDTVLETKEKQKETLKSKFKKKLEALDDTGNSLNLNGVKLTKNSLEYAEQKLSCDQVKMVDLVEQYAGYRGLDDFNFDTVSADFFGEIEKQILNSWETKTWSGKIGEIEFNLENKVSKNKAGSTMRLVYINGYKVKKDEVGEIIKRGLCYDEQAVFDGFCHQVSKCSLKLHKYLNEGVQLKVYDDYKAKYINFKIPLVRKSGKNFIVLDGEEYGVSDSNRLIKLNETRQMHDAINTLLNPKIVRIDGPTDIAHIINKGEELHEQDKNKNKQLIEKVEKLFKIEVATITNNGERQRGYVIDGKMAKYFLDIGRTDRETIFDRLRVFSYPDMAYVCMIDKTVQQTGPSNLINRIFALHNDSLVARDISTLNQTN